MSIDCQWIEKNLEALFCDGLGADETRAARAHIESCAQCSQEIEALNAIDPLVKKYFQQQMTVARTAVRPRSALRKSFVYSAAGAAVAALLLLALMLRAPQPTMVNPAPLPVPENTVAESAAPPPVIKSESLPEIKRAKPDEAAGPAVPIHPAPVVAPDNNAPQFVVTDPAGYSHTLDEYRGKVALIGVWSHDQQDAIANIESLYRTFAANTRLRFLGVSNERPPAPSNITFPVFYNQGSKLLGAQAGEFVVVDEAGSVALRGSLVRDFEELRRLLQEKN